MKNSTVSLNAEADVWGSQLDSGSIKIYDGTAPANPQTAITTQTLLVSISFSATAFPSAIGGVITLASAINGTIVSTATAGWARLYKTDGTTVVCDATVGLTSADVILDDLDLVLDDIAEVQSMSYTRPES